MTEKIPGYRIPTHDHRTLFGETGSSFKNPALSWGLAMKIIRELIRGARGPDVNEYTPIEVKDARYVKLEDGSVVDNDLQDTNST